MLISLIIIVILSIASSLYFHREALECLPFSVFGLTFILYLFGILNLLEVALYVICAITILSLVYIIHTLFYNKKAFLNVLPFKLLIFCGVIIFVYTIINGSQIIAYDEFTAWGLFPKSMFYTDELYIYNKFPVLAKSYQSATGLFQYFVNKMNGDFSETLLSLSMNIIFFSMTFSLLRNLKLKQSIEITLRIILIFLIPFTLNFWPNAYYAILVDFILGIAFGYILYYYFTSKLDTFKFINIAFAIFFLTCSKGNGLILSLLSLFIIYFDILFFDKSNFLNFILQKKKDKSSSKISYKNLATILSPVFICLFTYISWQISLSLLDIPSPDTKSLIGVIFKPEFRTNSLLYLKTLKSLLLEYLYFTLSFLVLLYGILATIWKKLNKKELLRSIIMGSIYLICLSAYCLFLFIVCSTIPTTFLATQALNRYLLTLVANNVLLMTFLCIHFIGKKTTFSLTIIIIIIVCITTPVLKPLKFFLTGGYTSGSIDFRKQYDSIYKIVDIVDPEEDVVYFLGEQEIDPYISYFNTFPLALSIFPTWNNDLSLDEYREYLIKKPNVHIYPISTQQEKNFISSKQKNDVYLYIFKANEEFKLKNQSLFEEQIENETLYKIEFPDNSIVFKKEL